jgi:tellurite resistance protein TerC
MTDLPALVIFNLAVIALLGLDLAVFHRGARPASLREAALWSCAWVVLALAFNAGVYLWRGPQPALEFFTAYLLEKSLSADNVFAFSVVLGAASVPLEYQHKVLFWGVLGALVVRGAFIATGAVLLSHFAWAPYLFGALLLVAGMRLLFSRKPADLQPEPILLSRLARRILPVSESCEGGRFFARRAGHVLATPLLLAVVMVETTDIVFAVDSIPAVFAVTQNPFIVYTSNVLAILGLRALYFVLVGAIAKFHYLRAGLSVVLIFVGAKMLAAPFYKLPITVSLLLILSVVAVAICASLRGQWLGLRGCALNRVAAVPTGHEVAKHAG